MQLPPKFEPGSQILYPAMISNILPVSPWNSSYDLTVKNGVYTLKCYREWIYYASIFRDGLFRFNGWDFSFTPDSTLPICPRLKVFFPHGRIVQPSFAIRTKRWHLLQAGFFFCQWETQLEKQLILNVQHEPIFAFRGDLLIIFARLMEW